MNKQLLAVAALAAGSVAVDATPIEHNVRGTQYRQFIFTLAPEAPSLRDVDQLNAWLSSEFAGMRLEKSLAQSTQVYNMVPEGKPEAAFRGFAAAVDPDQLAMLRSSASVLRVEEDSLDYDDDIVDPKEINPFHRGVSSAAAAVPTRPDWGQMRVDQRTLDVGSPSYEDINPPNRGESVHFWVLDGGVWGQHQEFMDSNGQSRVIEYENFASDSPPQNTFNDCRGHGTHVAGSVAGAYRGISIAAPTISSLRITNCQGSGAKSQSIAAMGYALENKKNGVANIATMSVGGSFSQAQNDAVGALVAGGVVYACSAGNNSGQDSCERSPAGAPAAITVGSTTSSDARSSFSNVGPCVNVYAPGSSIDSADLAGRDRYSLKSGTSMATPIASGSIGIYCSTLTDPSQCSGADVMAEIERTSTKNMISGLPSDTNNWLIYDRWTAAEDDIASQ